VHTQKWESTTKGVETSVKTKTWKCKKGKDRKGKNEITQTKVLCNNPY